jgi:CHAT domain
MIRILFVAANPIDTNPLRLGEELRQIQAKLRSADSRASFELRSVFAVRPDDLLQQMNEFRPHILHFSGHGSSVGEITLEDSTGRGQPVSAQALRALFANFRRWLSIVVLNACYSENQAYALLDSADVVIGMKSSIGDKAAILFAATFYGALGFDRSVQDAFDQGLVSLQLEGIPEEAIPTLLHGEGVDPSQLTITQPSNITEIMRRANDPAVPASIRRLLKEGADLLLLDDKSDDSPLAGADRTLLELHMRQSSAIFVIEVNRNRAIGRTARLLAQRLLPDVDVDEYDWTLVKDTHELPEHHTFAIAGLRAGDEVLLVGNHRRPMWAPRASIL